MIRFIAHEDGKPYFGEPVDPKLDIGLAYRDGKPIYARILLGDPLAADAQGRATAQLSADQKSVKKVRACTTLQIRQLPKGPTLI